MAILFHAHSGLRYLVLLAGVVAVIYYLVALVRRSAFTRRSRLPLTILVGLLDVQILLGLVLLVTRPFFPAIIGHLTMMIFAAAVAHAASIANKRRPETERSHGIALAGTILALASIAAGILAIGRPMV